MTMAQTETKNQTPAHWPARFKDLFDSTPMPGREDEAWRKVSLRGIGLDNFSSGHENQAVQGKAEGGSLLNEFIASEELVLAGKILFYGNALESSDLPAGVELLSFEDAASKYPEQWAQAAEKFTGIQNNRFDYHLSSQPTGGTFILVKADTSLEGPLYIGRSGNSALFDNKIIFVESGASVQVIDELCQSEASGGKGYAATHTLLWLGENAKLEYYPFSELSSDTFYYGRQTAVAEAGALLKTMAFRTGGFRSKEFIRYTAQGSGSRLELTGLAAAAGREFQDIDAEFEHLAADTTSNILYKCGVTDRAHTVFTGNLVVPHKFGGVQAAQLNRNLLLTDSARAESVPKLQVEPENVQCTHGSSIGFLDEEPIYYLQNRGIGEKAAKLLLIQAFFAEVLDAIGIPGLKDFYAGKIGDKLDFAKIN